MRIQILSDLHLEFAELENPQAPDADVVILAGDIHVGTEGVRWALENFSVPVVYVAGNHEFYSLQREPLLEELRQLSEGSRVNVLERDITEIDGVCFLGTTLWTDFALHGTPEVSMRHAGSGMADFHAISETEDTLFTPEDALNQHRDSLAWLGQAVRDHSNKKFVVVTHHAPSVLSIAAKFENDALNPAFVSDLDPFIAAHNVPLWIHGHTHSSFDYQLHGTRVVCNPRGYQPYENDTGFELHRCVSY